MRSLVTGGAGFIGSNLVDELINIGHDVVCIDNESSDANESFYWNKNCRNFKLDICDYEKILPLFEGVDFVFHLAAEARIQPAILNPLKAVKTNVCGTANVLQASREHKIKRLIYSSTSSAYGFNPIPNKENMPDNCLNPYSVSKVAGEKLCSMYTNLFGIKTVILRYFNVYGNRQPLKGQYAPVIGIFARQKQNKESLTIVGDGLQRRDFTNVSDVVQANILAATVNFDASLFGTIFNVGTGVNYSILEIAKMISDNYIHIDPRPGEMRETLADITKIQSTFKWNPTINLKDYIKLNTCKENT